MRQQIAILLLIISTSILAQYQRPYEQRANPQSFVGEDGKRYYRHSDNKYWPWAQGSREHIQYQQGLVNQQRARLQRQNPVPKLDFSDMSTFTHFKPTKKQYCQHKFLKAMGWGDVAYQETYNPRQMPTQTSNGVCESSNMAHKPQVNLPVYTGGRGFYNLNQKQQGLVMSTAQKSYSTVLDGLLDSSNKFAVCSYKRLVNNRLRPNIQQIHKHSGTPTEIIVNTLNWINDKRDDQKKPLLAFPLESRGDPRRGIAAHPDHDKFMIRFDSPQTCGWQPAIVDEEKKTHCSIAKKSPSATLEGYIQNANGGCTVDCAVGLQLSQLVAAYGPYQALGDFGKKMFDKNWKKSDVCIGSFSLIKDVDKKKPGQVKAGTNPFYNSFYLDKNGKKVYTNKKMDIYGVEMAKKGRFHLSGASGYIGLTRDKYKQQLDETTARGLNFMLVDANEEAVARIANGELADVAVRLKRRFFRGETITAPDWLDGIVVYSHPNKKYESLKEALVHMIELNPKVEYEVTLYPETMNKMLYERFRDDFVNTCIDERRELEVASK